MERGSNARRAMRDWPRWPVLAIALLAVCTACSPAASSERGSSLAVASASAASPPASDTPPSAAPSDTPSAAAPPELQGTWESTISTGEDVTLELRASGYTVNRAGAIGSGSIEVDGGRIVFSSARCELGPGTYEWSIDGETLSFAPIDPRDPCGNRIIFLEGASYTRVE